MISVICVVTIVMTLIYALMDRERIFASNPLYTKLQNNQKETFKYRTWEEYGYLDYVSYADYLSDLQKADKIDAKTKESAAFFAKMPSKDSPIAKQYVKKFQEYYESKGYTVIRRKAVVKKSGALQSGGGQTLFAYKDRPLIKRLWKYFTGIIFVDNIHKAEGDVGKRGIKFTFRDPAYGGKFSPAIIGNGTTHKYLLYFNNKFPYIHQNLIKINLGVSYSVNSGIDIYNTMTDAQGSLVKSAVIYPTGWKEESADNLHSAVYLEGSLNKGDFNKTRYTDDYTCVTTNKNGKSKMGYSFVIGIFSVIMAYVLGIPLGIAMARKKDKFLDKIGTAYIVFIMAVPSLAYIFMFKAIGGKAGLPTTFDVDSADKLMYVLPIVSLALPAVANLMKWLRRFMIDQMNADYVKFARSGGLSDREIFDKHILKNAIIPLVHGIPGAVLGALVGAIITERVYVVPGAGNLLIDAINKYDNSVIVGVTLFYAVLSVASLIMGDLLMASVDPRISFTTQKEQ